MNTVHFQGKPFNTIVIQVYAPISNAEEAEIEWFHEDLQDLLELTPKQTNKQTKDVLFIIRDWNTKVDHEILTAKLRLKLKKEEKIPRPFSYELNKIPYDYTMEVFLSVPWTASRIKPVNPKGNQS